jgi:hypothetical protein
LPNGDAAPMGDIINAYNILVEALKRRDHLGNLGVYCRTILKYVLQK